MLAAGRAGSFLADVAAVTGGSFLFLGQHRLDRQHFDADCGLQLCQHAYQAIALAQRLAILGRLQPLLLLADPRSGADTYDGPACVVQAIPRQPRQ